MTEVFLFLRVYRSDERDFLMLVKKGFVLSTLLNNYKVRINSSMDL